MARTNEEFISIMQDINPDIELVGVYTKAQDRIDVKCKICGHKWNPKAYYLTQGLSCPHCSAKRGAQNNKGKTGLKTQEKFITEMSIVHPDIKIIGEYINGHTTIECICSFCNHKWSAKPYSLLQGHECPRCVKSGTSFMEQFIKCSFEMALDENSIISRDKSAIGMEIDIFIPCLNIAIEPGNWILHKRSFKRDCEKRERCKDKDIRLITIYDKYPLNEKPPFDKDCFVFSDDLNKSDHCIIRNLVVDLLKISNIQYDFTDL